MDFTKFVSMLDKRSLWFSSLEVLSKDDPFEGTLTRVKEWIYELDAGSVPVHSIRWFFGSDTRDDFVMMIERLKMGRDEQIKLRREMRSKIYVNCWHRNQYESAAMWNVYCGSAPGIAITSNVERLAESLSHVADEVYISNVQYIDYSHEAIPEQNIMYPAIYKRMRFEHEKELRALIMIFEGEGKPGLNAECDLGKLVESVYVSPLSPSWYSDLVQSVTAKFGFSFPVRQSDMLAAPFI